MLKIKLSVSKSKERQTTIFKKIIVKGKSPYTNQDCSMILTPSKTNTGILFKVGSITIPATYKFIKQNETNHTTTLKKGLVEIRTVEHLLSAIWGLGIDNIIVGLSNSFIPMKSANAQEFVELLKLAGIKKLKKKRKILHIKSTISFNEKGDDRFAVFKPSNKFEISSTTSFNNTVGTRKVNFLWSPTNYKKEISWARSFLRVPLDKNLKIWGDVRKIFKFLPEDPKKSPIIVFDENHFHTPLKTKDEPARHKILDFIGDIALLGIRIKSEVKLFKPGHRFTRKIVKELAQELKRFDTSKIRNHT